MSINDVIRNYSGNLKSLIIFTDDTVYTYDASDIDKIPIDISKRQVDSYYIREIDARFYVNIML